MGSPGPFLAEGFQPLFPLSLGVASSPQGRLETCQTGAGGDPTLDPGPGERPWGREGILAFSRLVGFRSFFLQYFCSLRKGAEEGNFILQVCSPRHRNCVPSVFGSTWAWCVDPQVTSGLAPPLIQRAFTVDSGSVLFLPERSGLLQQYTRGKTRGGVRWKDQGWGFWSMSTLWFIGQVRLSEPELTQEQ